MTGGLDTTVDQTIIMFVLSQPWLSDGNASPMSNTNEIDWNKVDDDNETTLSGDTKDDLKGESGKPDSRANDLALVQSDNVSPPQLYRVIDESEYDARKGDFEAQTGSWKRREVIRFYLRPVLTPAGLEAADSATFARPRPQQDKTSAEVGDCVGRHHGSYCDCKTNVAPQQDPCADLKPSSDKINATLKGRHFAASTLATEWAKSVDEAVRRTREECIAIVKREIDDCTHPECEDERKKRGYSSCAGGHLARAVVENLEG